VQLDLKPVHAQFPALLQRDNGLARLLFGNPGRTQVPIRVAQGMSECLLNKGANLGSHFATSHIAAAAARDPRVCHVHYNCIAQVEVLLQAINDL